MAMRSPVARRRRGNELGLGLMAVVVTESTEFDRCALDRRGNMLGILNPGELGFGASGVFCTAAGVGVIGVSGAGGADGGRG